VDRRETAAQKAGIDAVREAFPELSSWESIPQELQSKVWAVVNWHMDLFMFSLRGAPKITAAQLYGLAIGVLAKHGFVSGGDVVRHIAGWQIYYEKTLEAVFHELGHGDRWSRYAGEVKAGRERGMFYNYSSAVGKLRDMLNGIRDAICQHRIDGGRSVSEVYEEAYERTIDRLTEEAAAAKAAEIAGA
jgi:hypothetical protein